MAAFPGKSAAAFAFDPTRIDASSADRSGCRADGEAAQRSLPTRLAGTAPSGVASRARDNEHARRAIAVMLRSLAWLPATEEVSRLREQGERLLATIDGWSTEAPLPEVREDAMRRIASLHLGAVATVRAAREGR
jgi:hypothetical protein